MNMLFLFRYGHISEVWELLKNVLPEWKLPLQEWEKALMEEEKQKKEETQSAVSIYGPRREKTCLRGVRQSEFQTSLLSYRD